jgi:lipoyl(octanoyl) transferase
MTRRLQVEWLGCMPYAQSLALQEARVADVRAGRADDALLLLEHPPVITLGRRARRENLLQSPDALAERGVELHEIARGGDVTWHGPGQLVGYTIMDLRARGRPDLHRFLRDLESGLIDALEKLGLAAEARAGMTGVFVAPSTPPRKIACIGVGLRGWVTWHGFALNVEPELAGFDAIVPCGLQGVEMTSLARELGEAVPADLSARSREAVADAFVRRFA